MDGTPRLQSIAKVLDARRRFAQNLRRVWFWREDTFVVDLESTSGVKYAFEIHEHDLQFSLRVVGRGAESYFAVRRAVKQLRFSRTIEFNASPITLVTWRRDTPDQVLAGDVLVNAQRLVTRLELESLNTSAESIPGYWWDMRINFGDLIGPRLIEHYAGLPVRNVYGSPASEAPLVTVGSIIDVVRRPIVNVWGTGLMNPPSAARVKEMSGYEWSISAVRGHLTRESLQERLGWDVTDVVGDPGLLFPDLVNPTSGTGGGGVAVIPHYSHKRLITRAAIESSGCQYVDVERSPQAVAEDVAGAGVVVSTSLHGLILAQAYDVPWVWLKISDQHLAGRDFKFEDFFSTVERDEVAMHSVEASAAGSLDLMKISRKARLPRSKYSLSALRDSFPYDSVA